MQTAVARKKNQNHTIINITNRKENSQVKLSCTLIAKVIIIYAISKCTFLSNINEIV